MVEVRLYTKSLTAGLGSVMVRDCVCIHMMAYDSNLQDLNSVIGERSKYQGLEVEI